MKKLDPFCVFLKAKLAEKQSRNKSYSLRAFATSLQVDQSTLTKVLRGERQFSSETQQRCIEKLAADEKQLRELTELIKQRSGDMAKLDEHVTELLSQWFYWAILELIKVPSFQHTSADIMARLGLNLTTVNTALERLEQFGFIQRDAGRFLLLTPNNSWTNTVQTTAARKALQKTFLYKSAAALDEIPFEAREHSSLTIAVDKDRIPEFKLKLKELRQEFGNFAQKNGTFTDVYQLTISLFPLTQDDNK